MERSTRYRIGEASELVGVSVDTLRYYEKLGLLPRLPRAPSMKSFTWVTRSRGEKTLSNSGSSTKRWTSSGLER